MKTGARPAVSAPLAVLPGREDRHRRARGMGRGAQLRIRVSAMSKERLYLFDTTLRDGAQTTGVDFSVAEKRRIAAVLDDLGIDYIEGGYPGANATDTRVSARRRRSSRRRR